MINKFKYIISRLELILLQIRQRFFLYIELAKKNKLIILKEKIEKKI